MTQAQVEKLVREWYERGNVVKRLRNGPKLARGGNAEAPDSEIDWDIRVSAGSGSYRKSPTDQHDEDNLGDPMWAEKYLETKND